MSSRRAVTALAFAALLPLTPAAAQGRPTVAQFLGPASPLSLASAKHADRIAWMAYERGMRNVYTAAAPGFTPVRLTSWLRDDGIDLSDVGVSDDGSVIVFVRGSAPNREGWVANPNHDPNGPDRAIWAVRAAGGSAWRVAEGASPELSPDGRSVLYVKDGQIYRARVQRDAVRDSMQTGLKPFIEEWGRQMTPQWSPDGSKILYVSDRGNHSFISVYDVRTRGVRYVAPSVDCDLAPVWSPDGKQIAFVRRPGIPFGRQSQAGSAGIGNPPGPGAGRGNPGVSGCMAMYRGFGGRQQSDSLPRGMRSPGFYDATLTGGYTLSIMVADVTSCSPLADGCPARELWHTTPGDSLFTGINRLLWARGHLLFPLSPPTDEWDRYYSLDLASARVEPRLLTTTDGMIEAVTDAALSRDGATLYYSTNATDIEKRHIWAVPVAGGTPRRISGGDGVETFPHPLSDRLAVLYFNAAQPASVALVPTAAGLPKLIFPTLSADFPVAAHVKPEIVVVRSPDSLEIHNQLFLPPDLKPGERRPAMIFVHGGPVRQMLPTYHYMQFYHWAYAYNQWLASQGYVVLSVNYRSGVGYGRSFRNAANTMARGNSEYQDVLAAGRYLQTRADVDPSRIGIWGLSYGGLLTAEALARNSDLFVAGADLAGVHLYGNSLDTAALSFKSSAVGAIDGWKSPVFLVHGDDDRNVDFAQTVGLVPLLRARNVYYELMVVPDDLHESMIHENWVVTFNRMGDFFKRFVWNRETPPNTVQAGGEKK
ncbi:MAG TPA: prolyl oligopeptidase family serine peptidase [Gemmatimonadaceae bacterium]|nr:prolyl oligopeptidase family serine peptidase [Gemmatimonadaceae bacterium]